MASEYLSQKEIDELLNMLTSDSSDTSPQSGASGKSDSASRNANLNVKSYNFLTAEKFPKEQRRTLTSVYTTFAQILSNQITGMLRTTCECELLSELDEMSFNELNNSLPDPVVLAIIEIAPMEGSQLLVISPEVAYMFVSRLLGGTSGLKGTDSSKQFTDIELALIQKVLEQIMHIFEEAWIKIIEVKARLDRLEKSSQFAQIVALNETMAVLIFELTIGGERGTISLGIPHTAIEPISKQLNTRQWYTGVAETKKESKMTEYLVKKLVDTPVMLSAYFTDTPATVHDVMSLQVGDYIRLNHKVHDPLLVKIQHIPKFVAEVGTSESKYAVKLIGIIREDNGE